MSHKESKKTENLPEQSDATRQEQASEAKTEMSDKSEMSGPSNLTAEALMPKPLPIGFMIFLMLLATPLAGGLMWFLVTGGDNRRLSDAIVGSVSVGIIAIASLFPLRQAFRRGMQQAAMAFLGLSGMRMLIVLVVGLLLVARFDYDRVGTLLAMAGTYVVLLVIEVVTVSRCFANTPASSEASSST